MQQLAVGQAQQALRRQAMTAAQVLTEDPEILALIQQIARVAADSGLDSARVSTLRLQLEKLLSGRWTVLSASGADQLHVHLSPGVVSLLRMHRPDSWGDSLTDVRPMLLQAQQAGEPLSGMEPGRHGAGMRGIVPIRASGNAGSPVVATLEVGFGMLPELQQLDRDLDSGLALLLNRDALRDMVWGQQSSRLSPIGDGQWWLDQYSRPELLEWLNIGTLGRMVERLEPEILEIDQRHFLITHIPVTRNGVGTDNISQAIAMILVWRDVSALQAQYQNERAWAIFSWAFAFIAALSLLGGLMLVSRKSVRQQEKHQQEQLRETVRHRDQDRALLRIIARAQSAYIGAGNQDDSFEQLLEQILNLTASEFGFVGEVIRDQQNRPYLQNYATGRLVKDAATQACHLEVLQPGMSSDHNSCLLGRVLQDSAPCICNVPPDATQKTGLPADAPELRTFIGLPILFGDKLIGIIGLANRPAEYSQSDADFLAPLLSTLGQLIHALHRDNEERSIRLRLEQHRQALRALNEIASLPSLNTVERLKRALDLGCQYLEMDFGIISHITGEDYTILAQHSPQNQLEEGQQFELGSTYCALTLQHDDVLSIEFMGESRFRDHPCYDVFKLESYLGVALRVNERRYGTLSFSSSEPRKVPFDNTDLEFIRLMGRWIGGTITRWDMEQERSKLLGRFNKLTQQLPGVVYQYQLSADGHACFPYASEGIRDVYGVSPAEAYEDASRVFDVIHPDDRDRVAASIQQSASTLSIWHDEYRASHPTMGELWLSGSSTPEALDNGDVIWHGFITDITARKHMELTIERERSRLANIILGTNVGTWELNLKTGETILNERWANIIGYQLAELQPIRINTWTSLFHPDDLVMSQGLLKSHLAGELDYYECDFRLRHKNGSWVWVKSRGRLISRDEQGNPLWISGTHADITTQIETTQALQDSQLRFRAMVSNLPGAVYRCSNDDSWTMSYLSDEISRITGYPASDFVDSNVRSYASIIHPEDLHLTYKAVELINRQRVFELSYRLIHARGHEVWVKEKGRGEYDSNGNLQWLSGFIWDATEQHRIDQLKNQFVSTVSHELRTPLTAISGALKLITNNVLGPVPTGMRDMLQVAQKNSHLLNNLIDDLLNMERLEAGKMHFDLRPQALTPLLLTAIEGNAGYAAQFQVQLELGHVDAVEVTVDAQRMGQILNNYLSNAIKFSYPGQSVLLEAHYAQNKVRIRVTDQGIGIHEDFHEQLFTKFSQADATDTRQRGGTGLGLAISRELATHMAAEVGFESSPGKGSSFWILLDARPPS